MRHEAGTSQKQSTVNFNEFVIKVYFPVDTAVYCIPGLLYRAFGPH